MNHKILETLEFDKIKELFSPYLLTELGDPDPSGEPDTRINNPYELNISPCQAGSTAPKRLKSLQPNLRFD